MGFSFCSDVELEVRGHAIELLCYMALLDKLSLYPMGYMALLDKLSLYPMGLPLILGCWVWCRGPTETVWTVF